ncbi:relaxase/mobilization nuclease domain-containing protein [Pseudomonas syringae pv. actinidiae]|nr:relaxase/mobilization nuclease domain-containing protein [Pseudomonas syringae pv. actinidiae]
MLIRVSGYNTGAQEYLEQGNKSGREFTRDELDHRLIIEGQLSVTRAIYESIPDHGQDRYLTFTLSFKEDTVSPELLKAVTTDFKNFFMHAYKPEEFNLYAEAHLPKMKTVTDRKTGEVIDRKPHIHIIIPRINLLSGNEANPVDVYKNHEKYFEAFQEHINQKYGLSSPRENVRADITDAASVLSRYKGDDFYGKNRQFKQQLVKQVIERGVTSRADFYALVAEHGETRIRNEGKDNEYISVKLPGDAKGTNLKDTIFQDDFIVRRELRKPPLEASVIQERLLAWPQRAREIKYVNKATPKFRKQYSQASPEERVRLLAERETNFYRAHGEDYETVHTGQRQRDHQRSPAETTGRRTAAPADGVQDLSVSDVADHRQAGPTRSRDGALLLPSDAHVHVGQSQPGGDSGLRSSVPGGGRGRRAGSTAERGRGGRQPAAVSQETKGTATLQAQQADDEPELENPETPEYELDV